MPVGPIHWMSFSFTIPVQKMDFTDERFLQKNI